MWPGRQLKVKLFAIMILIFRTDYPPVVVVAAAVVVVIVVVEWLSAYNIDDIVVLKVWGVLCSKCLH